MTVKNYAKWVMKKENIISTIYIKEFDENIELTKLEDKIKDIIVYRIEHPRRESRGMYVPEICPGCYLFEYAKIPRKFINWNRIG